MTERERLIELINNYPCMSTAEDRFLESISEDLTDYLLANGVIVPPCKVGDKVYYINRYYHIALYKDKIYEAKVVRIVTTSLGTALVIQIRDESGCTEIPNIKDFGKTVFLTKEEAEKALKERSEGE